jgi:serine/threonine protein kinase
MSEANKLILQIAMVVLGGVSIPLVALVATQPTHLLLDQSGIRFAARGLFKSKQLTWRDIDNIEVMRGAGEKGADLLVLQSAQRKLKLRLASLSHEDRTRLLDSIKRWAPMAVQDPGVVAALTSSRDQTYTELWLQAFAAPPKRESMAPLAKGALLNGKYRVIDYLGMGGQGTAYLAEDEGSGKVVLKEFVLPVYVDANVRRTSLKAFENEARILKTLNHDHVVKLLDFFVSDQRAYLVLEYVDGPSLRKLVETSGPVSQKRAAELAVQICKALEHLHSQSPPVVHRDVTPENLILSSSTGMLKLVDFNVAHQSSDPTCTSVVGKQAYLPPEQFRGEPCPQSDIYAAGGTMFYLLTGEEPEAITASRPKVANPIISSEFDALVAKATSLDLKSRYQTAELMRNDLECIASLNSGET